MGIDHLDFLFRLEKAFALSLIKSPVEIYPPDPASDPKQPMIRDSTVQEVHDNLCQALRSLKREVPFDSMDRVKKCVSGTCGVPIEKIEPHHYLVKDLGFE